MDSLACAEMVTRYGVSWLARNGVPYQSGVGVQLPKQNYVYYSAGSSVHIEHKDVDSDWSICLFLKQTESTTSILNITDSVLVYKDNGVRVSHGGSIVLLHEDYFEPFMLSVSYSKSNRRLRIFSSYNSTTMYIEDTDFTDLSDLVIAENDSVMYANGFSLVERYLSYEELIGNIVTGIIQAPLLFYNMDEGSGDVLLASGVSNKEAVIVGTPEWVLSDEFWSFSNTRGYVESESAVLPLMWDGGQRYAGDVRKGPSRYDIRPFNIACFKADGVSSGVLDITGAFSVKHIRLGISGIEGNSVGCILSIGVLVFRIDGSVLSVAENGITIISKEVEDGFVQIYINDGAITISQNEVDVIGSLGEGVIEYTSIYIASDNGGDLLDNVCLFRIDIQDVCDLIMYKSELGYVYDISGNNMHTVISTTGAVGMGRQSTDFTILNGFSMYIDTDVMRTEIVPFTQDGRAQTLYIYEKQDILVYDGTGLPYLDFYIDMLPGLSHVGFYSFFWRKGGLVWPYLSSENGQYVWHVTELHPLYVVENINSTYNDYLFLRPIYVEGRILGFSDLILFTRTGQFKPSPLTY